jgi:hypothetical protein
MPTSDVADPTRSSSLCGLGAITTSLKRTSAGLTGLHNQLAELLKECISGPRILSLGSISISNLRDAGIASGCDTASRIAWRVPPTGDVLKQQQQYYSTTQAVRTVADCNLPLSEAGLRCAGSPLKIPWPGLAHRPIRVLRRIEERGHRRS